MPSNSLPTPTGDTIDALMDWQRDHDRRAGPVQRFANRTADLLGRPATVALVLLLTVGWMCLNRLALRLGFRPLEDFPFPDLAFVATVAAFLLSLLILTAQRHAAELADKRAQLTLLIALLNEKRGAKLIELLEEQRRDNPLLASRTDPHAHALAQAADVTKVLDRL